MVADGGVSWAGVAGLVSVPLLVAANGLFVAAEFALVAVRRTRVEELVKQKAAGAVQVQAAVGQLDQAIAATQLGITLASIALGWLGEPALAGLIEPAFAFLPEAWVGAATHTVASAAAFCAVTFIHVVFGELVPKSVALQQPAATALWIAAPLLFFVRLTRPVLWGMNGVANRIVGWVGLRPAGEGEAAPSVEELSMLVRETESAGMLPHDHAEFVQQVFRLSQKTVGDCMVPRAAVAGIELSMSADQILDAVCRGAHTRMPVYRGDLDDVVGIVNTKDLFHLFRLKGLVLLWDAVYPPLYLKDSDPVARAFEVFRAARRPMALVRNAAGKVVGLITLEDVLEEIVGEIEDEHDAPPTQPPGAARSGAWLTGPVGLTGPTVTAS